MPNLNDYNAFKSTSRGTGSGGGCLPYKTIIFLTIIYAILTLLGQCKY